MLFYFALLSILITILISLYNWKVQKNTLYIAGILFILSAHGITHYYSDPAESDFSFALLFGTLTPLWLVPGPLLYFYFRSILTPEKATFTLTDSLHFVPFFVQLANITPYLLTSFEYKLQIAHAIHQNLNNLQAINVNAFSSYKTSFLSRPILLLVYLLWCTLFFLRQLNRTNLRTRNWLVFFIFSLFTTTIAYLVVAVNLFSTSFENFSSVHISPIYFSSGLVYTILPFALILFFPEVLYGIKRQKPFSTNLLGLSAKEFAYHESIAHKITSYLNAEKPFLNPEFEIADLAKAVSADPKEVSFACKHLLNKKFTDLRSHLRVAYAKELLQNGLTESVTIDSLGSSAGFKSRSTFYEAFKAETGLTPSQYLEYLA